MTAFKPGDRVAVFDPGLVALQRIFRDATGKEPPPNNEGVIESIEDGLLYVIFDDGQCAPYPASDTRLLSGR